MEEELCVREGDLHGGPLTDAREKGPLKPDSEERDGGGGREGGREEEARGLNHVFTRYGEESRPQVTISRPHAAQQGTNCGAP